MMSFLKKIFYPLLVVGIFCGGAKAALDIKITRGNINPIPLAIPSLEGESSYEKEMAIKIRDVIINDLKSSGLFRFIPESSYIQKIENLQTNPHYSEWRLIKADNLVAAKVIDASGGKIRVEFRVFDTIRELQLEGKAYVGLEKDWRRVAHKVADAIYKRLIGDDGYFDTQIAYVARTEKVDARTKKISRTERLAIMDQDGENHRYLTDGKNLVMSPRFSADLRYIAFLDYAHNKPRVYIYNRETRHTTLVGNFAGMTFAPRFSPDGDRLAMSFSHKGNTSLFEMNLKTLKIKRLTFDPVIDTSPSYSPDGSKIIFTSDRSGQTQLYVMNANGGSAKRISFGSGSYRTPVWSPRDDLIVFTKIWKGQFYIGVMRTDGSGERLITKGYLVEGPCWSPNGRVVLYTRDDRRGSPHLYTIDIAGFNERKLPTPTTAIQGTWSNKR